MSFDVIVWQMFNAPDGSVWKFETVDYFYGETTGKVRLLGRREPHKEYAGPIWAEKKEAQTMQVTYNGFTGDLVKLERSTVAEVTLTVTCLPFSAGEQKNSWRYDLSIYDSEKQVTHSFTGVKLENVKFLGGEVRFG